MALNPEIFRHMNPRQIALTLAIDEDLTRQDFAAKAGKKCAACLDTGMANGRFCGCDAGQKLGHQSFGDQANVG